MGNNKFSFWAPGSKPDIAQQIFGCSSHGFSTNEACYSPHEKRIATWEHELPGEVCFGSYLDVLKSLLSLPFTPKVCIVLYKNVTGFEEFISLAAKELPGTSFFGGGASYLADFLEGELLPKAEDVCVLAISGTNFELEVLNIYEDTTLQVEIKATSERHIARIKEIPDGEWQNAITYYRSKQIEFGIDADDFESLCFCDKNKRYLHCSISNENLFVGANLPKEKLLTLSYISHDKATEKLEKFIDDTDSLIFGCAGIRSMVEKPIFTGKRSLAGFMFGEIVTCEEKVELGNLMLTKLKIF